MLQALVTGGAGFIGSNLVQALRSAGHRVVVLDDLSSGYEQNVEPGVDLVRGDVRDGELVERLAKGCSWIFHLAASVGNKRSIDSPRLDADINLSGTIAVLEAARKNAIRRIVFSSSAGIFGELKTLPIAEDHPQDPDSPYGVSKLAAEKVCLVYNKLYGMSNVCLRYFNVYGVRQRFDAYGNVIPIFAERMLRNRTLTIHGDGEQTRDFVNVGDVVQANVAAASSEDAAGCFNIGSGERISINDLVHKMQRYRGQVASVVHGPERAGDVRHSLADVRLAGAGLNYAARVAIDSGLSEYLGWLEHDPITLARWQREA